MWKRRLAVTLVSQLPESNTEALEVLDLARFLVTDFLTDRSKSAPVIGIDGQPFLPPTPVLLPWKPKKGFPWWWGATLVLVMILATLVYAPGIVEATPGIVIKGARVENAVIAPGEPLLIRLWVHQAVNCTGIVHRSISRVGRPIIVLPIKFSELSQEEVEHTRLIALPPLPPGEYAYESHADFICGDGRKGTSDVGPLSFRVATE